MLLILRDVKYIFVKLLQSNAMYISKNQTYFSMAHKLYLSRKEVSIP